MSSGWTQTPWPEPSRPGRHGSETLASRSSFAASRSGARQLIRHRHVEVNGRPVDVPSIVVSVGDEISVRAKSRNMQAVEESLGSRTRPQIPEWLILDEKNRVGRMTRRPTRQDIPLAAQEQLIVELYSK